MEKYDAGDETEAEEDSDSDNNVKKNEKDNVVTMMIKKFLSVPYNLTLKVIELASNNGNGNGSSKDDERRITVIAIQTKKTAMGMISPVETATVMISPVMIMVMGMINREIMEISRTNPTAKETPLKKQRR